MRIIRTDTKNTDFKKLVARLDAELAERDGNDHAFYDQFNKIDQLKYAVVIYEDNIPVGCGALKVFNNESVEIKRMYVLPTARGNGLAGRILAELEQWAGELSFSHCVLETGKRQPEAVRLYQKNGYLKIPNYGPYVNDDNSLCFKKRIG